MEQKKLRVAVIGAGGWGYQHARAFSGRSDTELVAIARAHSGTDGKKGR